MLLADGFEDAFIGSGRSWQAGGTVAIYNRETCIEIIMRDGCSYEEAEEFFEFNVAGSYVGEQTPIFIDIHGIDEIEGE